MHPLRPRTYVEEFYKNSNLNDTVYGPYVKNDEQLYLGGKTLSFASNGDIIICEDSIYPDTEGLYKLIFRNRPLKNEYTYTDRANYLEI